MDNYESYICDANDRITFHIVNQQLENISSTYFKPTFTHQFFGENEKILGYKGLHIDISLSAGTLKPLMLVQYEEKLSNDDLQAHNLEDVMLQKVSGACTSEGIFKEKIVNDGKTYFGKIVKQFQLNEDETFVICHVNGDNLLTNDFQQFHNNMQYLLLFFVDGTSFIDITDPDWEYLLLYKKYKDPSNQEYRYDIIGFVTVHNFFAYPDNIRQRISQILILPPYQRKRFGEKMLQCLYEMTWANDKVLDVTVEDANDEFQFLRDYVDCKNCLELFQSVTKIDLNSNSNGEEKKNASMSNLKEIIKSDQRAKFSAAVKSRLKLSNKQVTRVFEILWLHFLDKSNSVEGMKYKLAVTKRLMGMCGGESDFSHTSAQKQVNLKMNQKKIMVEREYESLEQCYSLVINKLNIE